MVRRVRAEFLEMPGLRLTFAQAMRLWGLSENDCQRVIDALIDNLQETKDQVVDVDVLRGNQRLTFKLQPVLADAEDKTKRYRVGFESTARMKVGQLSLIPAFQRSLETPRRPARSWSTRSPKKAGHHCSA